MILKTIYLTIHTFKRFIEINNLKDIIDIEDIEESEFF